MDSQTQEYQEYYVPTQSYFPIVASVSLFCLAFGAASVLTAVENTGDMGMIMLFTGFILLFFVIISFGNFRKFITVSKFIYLIFSFLIFKLVKPQNL